MTLLETWAPFAGELLSWMLRGAALFAVALVAVRLLENRSAALRHAVLTGSVVAALAVPLVSSVRLPAVYPSALRDIPAEMAGWLGAERVPDDPTLLPPGTPVPQWSSEPTNARQVRIVDYRARVLGLVVLVWIAGAALLLLRRLFAVFAAHLVRRRAQPVTDEQMLALVRRAGATQGVHAIPELRASPALHTPATLGCIRPIILLPDVMRAWPASRFYPVLAHELAHVARRDCLTTLLGDICNAVYWCNPFTWLLTRRMTVERERACDDRALTSGIDPTQYGMLLLDVARSAYGKSLPASVLMMARPKELESRLLAIVRGTGVDRARVSRRGIVLIATATALLGSAAAGQAATQSARVRTAMEPDRRSDSVTHPMSEVMLLSVDADSLDERVRNSALWSGPDSVLVRRLTGYIQHAPAGPTETGVRRAYWLLSRARGDDMVDELLAELGSRDWRAQSMAAWGLALGRERRAVPGLMRQLEHPIWRVRAMAAWALYEIADSSALPAVLTVLDDEAWQVRMPAVSYIAEYARLGVALRLIEPRLRDRHIAVRRAASEALETIGARMR